MPEVSPESTPCSGGSQPKPDQQLAFWVSGSAICFALGALWTPLAGAACEIAVPYLLDLNKVCASPPPAPVQPPWHDILSNGLLPTPNAMWDWMSSTFISQNWNTWCQCVGGTGCGSGTWSDTITSSGFSRVYGPIHSGATGNTTLDMPWSYTNDNMSSTATLYLDWYNSSNAVIVRDQLGPSNMTASNSGTYHNNFAGNSAYNGAVAVGFEVFWTGSNPPSPNHCAVTGNYTWSGCGNPINPYVPPAVPSPPADIPAPPPVPTGCTLDQICAKVTYVENELDNIARLLFAQQLPLSNLSAGVVHSGLNGNGSFNLQASTIALGCHVTARPPGASAITGNPTFYPDQGFITPYSPISAVRGQQIAYGDQTFQLPLLTKSIGYSLRPGVTATFTELSPVYQPGATTNPYR